MSAISYTCWLCGGVNLLAHPSLHQIAPCPTCIEKLRAVVAPSPASAAPEQQHALARSLFVELEKLYRQYIDVEIDTPGEIAAQDAMCAAIARVSPHFAPRPKVRLPKKRKTDMGWGSDAHDMIDSAWNDAIDEIELALRSAGIEIEGASDEA